MAREIPEVVRAAAGLAATVLDEARKLPETLPGLPVRVIGRAMQHALKVQQTYAGFVARGDELFTGFRGEDEPGMATFDDEEPLPASTGFRESAFDRADIEPTSAATDLIVDEELALEELAAAPDAEEILDEIAIDELVDQAPTLEETAPTAAAPAKAAKQRKAAAPRKAAKAPKAPKAPAQESTPATTTAADTVDAEPSADVATPVDVLTPASEPAPTPSETTATAAPASSGPDSQAAGPAPVDGYDSLTIAQLRGRMRGYVLSTVSDLLAYEQATRAREPYLRMLRNRLEKLEEQAVESSPLAPRGV